MFDLSGKKIWVAGHRGMVGSATARRLATVDCEIITLGREVLDLRRQADVDGFVDTSRPDAIVLAAGTVGGILDNDTRPLDFLHDNLMIASNVMAAAHRHDVDRLLFLGSSCIYPKFADQPIAETAMLTGSLEPTNEWYAIAKIAGVKLTQAYRRQHGRDYISAMPTNLYGPGDNFDLGSGHVLAATIRKVHEAKISNARDVVVWGTGAPRREFLHVHDCAEALVFMLQHYSGSEPINVGYGADITILELAELVGGIVGFEGRIRHDLSRPDGTPRKLLDSGRLRALGWAPSIDLQAGIADTYQWFLQHHAEMVPT